MIFKNVIYRKCKKSSDKKVIKNILKILSEDLQKSKRFILTFINKIWNELIGYLKISIKI